MMNDIKKNRPNITAGSLKTYHYILKRLLRLMGLDEHEYKKIIDQPKKVLQVLSELTPLSRKTTLAVLMSLFGNNEKTDMFNEQMVKDAHTYSEQLKTQKKTEKQQENWMSWDEIVKTYKYVYRKASPSLTKERRTKKEMMELVDLIMLACYVLIPPRRSNDYTQMKIKNYTEKKDNYVDMKKGILVFNQYKTNKTYGEQQVKMSPPLKSLLKKWIKINPTDYLLFDSKGKPFSSSRLTLRMNNIFGRNISTSMLRHIYLSDRFAGQPTLKENEDLSEAMGHSIQEQQFYRKV